MASEKHSSLLRFSMPQVIDNARKHDPHNSIFILQAPIPHWIRAITAISPLPSPGKCMEQKTWFSQNNANWQKYMHKTQFLAGLKFQPCRKCVCTCLVEVRARGKLSLYHRRASPLNRHTWIARYRIIQSLTDGASIHLNHMLLAKKTSHPIAQIN